MEANTQCSLKKPLERGFGTLGALAVALVSLLYLFPVTHLLHRVGDEGTVVYGAQRVLEGQIPSRDFLELIGPGSFYWLALFFKLLGLNWQVTRFFLLFNGVATALLIYWITRRYIRGAVSFLPCLLALILGLPFWPACSHHWDSNLFALATLACFLKWQGTARNAWLIAAGALAGLTSCFMQQKGLFLLLAFTAAILASPSVKSRLSAFSALSRLLTAYACVGAFVLLLFFRAGALRDLLYANFAWPLSSYETVNSISYANGLVGAAIEPCASFLRSVPVPLGMAIACLCLLPFLVVAALPLFLLAGALICRFKPHLRHLLFQGPLITLWLTGIALWLSEIHRKDIFHLLYGAPLLVTAVVVSAESLFAGHRVKKLIVGAIAGGLVMLGFFKLTEYQSLHRIETPRGTVLDTTQDAALTFLNCDVARREWVFVYPYYPLYYYLADIGNPTRFSILLYHYNTPEHFDEVIRDLETKHVKYVLWDTVVDGANLRTWFPAYVQPDREHLKLESYLHSMYDVVAIKNGFRILRRNRY